MKYSCGLARLVAHPTLFVFFAFVSRAVLSQESNGIGPTARVRVAPSKVDSVPCLNISTVGEVHKLELGSVHLSSHTGFQFLVRNRTNRSWHVHSLKVGCGCVVPDIALFDDNKQIDPGDGGLATIRGALNSGAAAKLVTVPLAIMDDDGTELAIISINANIQKRFELDKNELLLEGPIGDQSAGRQTADFTATATFDGENLDSKNFELKSGLPIEFKAEQISPQQVRLRVDFAELSRKQLISDHNVISVSYHHERDLIGGYFESIDLPLRFTRVFRLVPSSMQLERMGEVCSGEFIIAGDTSASLTKSKLRCKVAWNHGSDMKDIPSEIIRASPRLCRVAIKIPKEYLSVLGREFVVSVFVDDLAVGELKVFLPE